MWVETTGNAVAMYSCTTALRIAVLRSSSIWHSTLPTANRRGRLDHRARGQGAAAPARQHEDGTAGCRQRDEDAVRQRPRRTDGVADDAGDRAADRCRAEEGDRRQ